MSDLYAFVDKELVGAFHRTAGGQISFEYADSHGNEVISLSLPRDGHQSRDAASSYLDNLLPDNQDVRDRWARLRDLDSADPFTLLGAYGEDVAGAVSLSPDPDLPHREPETVVEATEDDIAERIASLRHSTSSWTDPRVKPRMSLAGQQGKFTLTHLNGKWYWPTYEVPSTHILKPPSEELKSIEKYESLGLELARSIGIRSSVSKATSFLGQPTFIVERWDRSPIIRLPAEDLNQSLGYPTDDKYKVGAPEVARLLDQHGMAREFVRQLAFNVALGNADAHAKNYSVLLVGGRVQLAPLYDAVPVLFWPKFNQKFAMPIGTAVLPVDLTEENWKLFAIESGLDPDMVCHDAFTVMNEVSERYHDAFSEGGADESRLKMIRKRSKLLKRAIPKDFKGARLLPLPRLEQTGPAFTLDGDIWVEAYVRQDGTAVEGYWRKRRS